jgi:hypothetical protein
MRRREFYRRLTDYPYERGWRWNPGTFLLERRDELTGELLEYISALVLQYANNRDILAPRLRRVPPEVLRAALGEGG